MSLIERPSQARIGITLRVAPKTRPVAALSTSLPTSYWLDGGKETAAINTFLIIVNSIRR
jgi:hypothetical protein